MSCLTNICTQPEGRTGRMPFSMLGRHIEGWKEGCGALRGMFGPRRHLPKVAYPSL